MPLWAQLAFGGIAVWQFLAVVVVLIVFAVVVIVFRGVKAGSK